MMTSSTTSPTNAFLTAIASFRAVQGSYEIEALRHFAYHRKLNDNEWQDCLALYESKLKSEHERNQKQKAAHANIAKQLTEKIEQLKKIARTIPEIEDVFLVNSFTFGALKPTSDIDVLVVTKPNTIWWARLQLTAALEKAGIRRKPGHTEEQICLSFFVTTDSMDMSIVARPDDIHFAYWAALAHSLLGKLDQEWFTQNKWLTNYFPGLDALPLQTDTVVYKPASFLSVFMNQLVRIPMRQRSLKKAQLLGPESSIVITDDMLKFHNVDRRKLYREKTWSELKILQDLCK